MTLQDFDVEGRIGDGSFSQVLQARVSLRHPSAACTPLRKVACFCACFTGQRNVASTNPAVQPGGLEACSRPARLPPLARNQECRRPLQVRHKVTGRQYALKVVDKHLVLRHRLVGQLRQERNILDRCAHPAVARLHFTFQDEGAVYLGLELCPNGPPWLEPFPIVPMDAPSHVQGGVCNPVAGPFVPAGAVVAVLRVVAPWLNIGDAPPACRMACK